MRVTTVSLLVGVLGIALSAACRSPRDEGADLLDQRIARDHGETPYRAGRYYRLQKGDTLFSVARAQYGASQTGDLQALVDAMIKVNAIDDPSSLAIGSLIFLPDRPGTAIPTRSAPAPNRP